MKIYYLPTHAQPISAIVAVIEAGKMHTEYIQAKQPKPR